VTGSGASKRSQTGDIDHGAATSKHPKILQYLNETKWLPSDKRQKDCTDKLACMICVDLQPISIVEDKGFKDFVNCLQPLYNIPDRPGPD
jgi:hypothetical protein